MIKIISKSNIRKINAEQIKSVQIRSVSNYSNYQGCVNEVEIILSNESYYSYNFKELTDAEDFLYVIVHNDLVDVTIVLEELENPENSVSPAPMTLYLIKSIIWII